jgi:hypothetical protein
MVYYPGILSAAVVAPPFTPRYVDFDGSNDFMLRGAALSGVSDGKMGIVSFWVIFDGLGATTRYIFSAATTARLLIRWFASTALEVSCQTTAGAQTLVLRASTTLATATPYHVCFSWNLNTAGTGRVYVNNASAKTEVTYNNNNIDYTDTNYAIGAGNASGIQKLDGRLGELYINLAEYLDLDTTSNLRKFISAGGAPVDLGSGGATPTGNAPAVYCSSRDSGTPSDFANNRGNGGNFSITGALTDGGAI